MVEYQLTIKIENDILACLTCNKCSLCLKKFLRENQDQPIANVVFAAEGYKVYGKSTQFNWNDSYSIVATNKGFFKGGIAPPGDLTFTKEISTGESAFLGPRWIDFEVKDDPKAPEDGFGFRVVDTSAAAAVYLGTKSDGNDSLAPFFISKSLHQKQTFTTLVPCERVMVCFEKGATVGTMTTHTSENDKIIELTEEEPKQTWKLFNDGHWEKVV